MTKLVQVKQYLLLLNLQNFLKIIQLQAWGNLREPFQFPREHASRLSLRLICQNILGTFLSVGIMWE